MKKWRLCETNFSHFFFLENENGGVVAAEELLVMVGNVLEPAAAEVVEAEVAEVLKSAAAGLAGVGLKH